MQIVYKKKKLAGRVKPKTEQKKKMKREYPNFNIRCSLKELHEVVQDLKEAQKEKIALLGFGSLLDCNIKGNVSRPFIVWIMDHLNPNTMKLEFGGGRVLEVTPQAVEAVFGFPRGVKSAPKPSDQSYVVEMRKLQRELGTDKEITAPNQLRDRIKTGGVDDLTMRCFFLVVFMKVLCPTFAVCVTREAAMVDGLRIENMLDMDFCQLVVEELRKAARKWHAPGSAKNTVEGCVVMLLVMYVDSYKSRFGISHQLTPRVKYYSNDIILKVIKDDQLPCVDGEPKQWGRCSMSIFSPCIFQSVFLFYCF